MLEHDLSRGESIEHQLALDEALARALELGDDFNHLSVNEGAVTAVTAVGTLLTPTMLLFISCNFVNFENEFSDLLLDVPLMPKLCSSFCAIRMLYRLRLGLIVLLLNRKYFSYVLMC